MGREEFELLRGGVVKRKTQRRLGLFIDGIGLDRATRRLERKVDLKKLVSGLTSGLQVEIARYYTLIPNEDDARQLAFLDAVERAGLEVVVKRLPPKGVKRQVSMDVHLATDLISFSFGHFAAASQTEEQSAKANAGDGEGKVLRLNSSSSGGGNSNIRRVAVLVCPNREASYALFTAHELGAEATLADFGLYGQSDGWRNVDRWVDLSTSETIWRG